MWPQRRMFLTGRVCLFFFKLLFNNGHNPQWQGQSRSAESNTVYCSACCRMPSVRISALKETSLQLYIWFRGRRVFCLYKTI
jgi:hypothetical protein